MLRFAKEKFRSRGLETEDEKRMETEQSITSVGDATSGEESEGGLVSQIKDELMSGVESERVEEAELGQDGTSEARSPGMVPTVAIDDEVSYELLRPVARHILSKLDQTLAVLHNARMAVVESGSDFEEDEDQEAKGAEPKKSPKRKTWTGDDTDTASEKPSSRRRTQHAPQEGETDREMQVRLAKKYHRRVPRFSDEEGETTAAETAGSSKARRRKKVRVTTRSMARDTSNKPDSHSDRGSRLDRLSLRDWSDVLGAAALAGFSPNVIARATQRCSDLFGQGMEFNTLYEEPASGRANKSRSTRYTPGLPTTDEESHEEEGYRSAAEQIRAVSRASSVIVNDSSSEDENKSATTPGTPGTSRRGRRKGRAYSVAPSVVRLYCPHANCSGAINGFTRRYNLKQHLITVHGKTPEVLSEGDDDMDEMHGAVHLDGFLKPIRPKKGWRAADTGLSSGRRQQRRGYRKTGARLGTPPPRQFYSDAGYHAEADEEDMIGDADDGDYV
ncbi:hypothetical protein GE09DRAFT_1090394 [Coniochaeta sp. 2T2.1]|nr:hypothetical protein GE09DRAFT_1090394 [Coniochaeta sp. 2T2.1]